MRITFFIGQLYGGGAERVVCNLANYLTEKKHQVEVICMTDEERTYELSSKVKRYNLLKRKERKCFVTDSILRFIRLMKYLLNYRVDSFIVFLPITTILLLKLRVFAKGKVIASERVDPNYYSLKIKKQLQKVANKADGWVFQTQEERDWYGTATGNAKIEIIPNAINPDFIKPLYKGNRRKTIVTVGRLSIQKRQDILIRAFGLIKDDFPDYNLEIYGEGSEMSNLKDLIKSLNLDERVYLQGNYSPIDERIRDAALFVLSSDFEGIPNALMEAMALGLPCVSTDCDGGGAKFLIKNEYNGLLVPKNDIEALAAAIQKMLLSIDYAMSMGLEASKIQNQLSPELIYGKWEKFITDIVKNES